MLRSDAADPLAPQPGLGDLPALKHAAEARTAVHVRYGPDSLELEIVDDGAGAFASVSGGGHGLVGMRERVALYGGRFDAGRRASGGFAVRVLPPIR